MRKRIKHQWEEIESTKHVMTARLAVYGGWKVITGLGKEVTSIFVSDPDHQWQVLPPDPKIEQPAE